MSRIGWFCLVEFVVDTGADHAEFRVATLAEGFAKGVIVPRVEIDVEPFELRRDVLGYGIFGTAAEGPTAIGAVVAVIAEHRVDAAVAADVAVGEPPVP